MSIMSKNVKIICDDVFIKRVIERNIRFLKERDFISIFERACPNCFNHVSDVELEIGHSCGYHENLGGLKGIIDNVNKQVEDFSKFFEYLIGYPPSSVQRIWAMRILSGQNTAIIAPTGMGKTTFGLVMALYLALKGKISYIILPTKTLLEQVLTKLKDWEKKLNTNFVIAYTGKTSKDREVFFNALRTGQYRVIITTLQFFARYIKDITEILQQTFCREKSIDFMFVDDVDSFLRNPRNLARALLVLGYRGIWGISEVLEKLREMASLMRTGQYEQMPELSPTDWEAILEARKNGGILVVSSATGRIRGQLTKLILSYILGMSVGGEKEGKRNVLDLYVEELLKKKEISIDDLVTYTTNVVKKLGTGGLIFVAMGPDSDMIISKLEKMLRENGIRAENIEARKEKAIKDFEKGDVDILIGKAYRYGLLVRGLDLPERVRYTIFVKIPRFSARLMIKLNPIYLSFIMKKIARALGPIGKKVVEKIRQLVSATMWLSPEDIKNIEEEANKFVHEIARTYFAYYISQLSSFVEKKTISKTLLPGEIPISSHILDLAYNIAKEKVRDQKDKKTQVFLTTLELAKILSEFLETEPIKALKDADIPFEVREVNGQKEIYILTSDVKTYIQASGRASRLYAGGITYGISIIIPSNKSLLNEFEKKLKWITDSVLKPMSSVNLDEELKKVDEDRKRVRAAREGKISPKEMLKTCLFIVESPRKAKTIASFFGKPVIRILPSGIAYETVIGNYLVTVIATLGHLTDLVTHKFIPIFGLEKRGNRLIRKIIGWKLEMLDWPYGIAIVDIDGKRKFVPIFGPRVTCPVCLNTYIPHITVKSKQAENTLIDYLSKTPTKITNIHDFFELLNNIVFPLKCPVCGNMFNPRDRLNMIETLRLLASEVDVVAIGTDPDIEGEKIAWDLYMLLKPFARKIVRVEFHEVTRRAIEEALKNPRTIDTKMVRAQIARRIEDRWIGFLLSEEIRDILQERNLSAGRVQTPVLGWVIDAYENWLTKRKTAYIIRLPDVEKPLEFTVIIPEKMKEPLIKSVEITKVEFYEKEITPPPPLTTDAMLTLSSRILDLDVRQTMLLAQKLFESGLITYIRTDSTRVSDVGIAVGKKLVHDYFGAHLHVPRDWSRRPEEGAHECIRPTRPLMLEDLKEAIEYEEIVLPEKLPPEAFELYDLITRIFTASQMKKAKVRMLRIKIKVTLEEVINGEKVTETVDVDIEGISEAIEEGFIKAYNDKMRELLLPKFIKLPAKRKFSGLEIEVEKTEIREARLLTDGDLVRLMREKKIGRPSTYAIIIDKLFKRKYIKHHLGKFLRPTRRGRTVFYVLNTLHGDLVSEKRTADLLKRIDEIEEAKTEEEARTKFLEIVNNLYQDMKELKEILANRQYFEMLPPEKRKEVLDKILEYRERVIRFLLRTL